MNKKSFKKYSDASKARWAKKSPEVRKEEMRLLAVRKWSLMTDEQKSQHGKMMIQAKLKNKN